MENPEILFIFGFVFIIGLSIYYHIWRVGKGKQVLIDHLRDNDFEYVDIRWKMFPPMKGIFSTSKLQLFFIVTLDNNQTRLFKVGSFWTGLLNPVVVEI